MNYNFTVCESFGGFVPQQVMLEHLTDRKNLGDGIEMAIFSSIKDMPCWDKFVPENHHFLRTPFLECLETHPPKGMTFCYLVFYKKNQIIGVANCQMLHFNAESSINEEGAPNNTIDNIGRYFKKIVARQVDFNTFICGNMLLTGEHGFYFNPALFSQENSIKLLTKGLEQARKSLEKEGISLPITFLKEYFDTTKENCHPSLTDEGYKGFCIQPNMVFDLSELWLNFDDYLAAMTSKYRVRAKRALKKAKTIERRELSLEEIRDKQAKIYDLYLAVANKSGFNSIMLHPTYFTGLKEHLGEAFRLTAYFEGEEMVSYFTTIEGKEDMEAHFLGYDMGKNYTFQLYHNMLFDIIRQGIELRTPRIIFARTALEIKSSVGAVAHEMHCYIKHRSNFSNKFVIKLFDYLNKPEEWTPRHPFK